MAEACACRVSALADGRGHESGGPRDQRAAPSEKRTAPCASGVRSKTGGRKLVKSASAGTGTAPRAASARLVARRCEAPTARQPASILRANAASRRVPTSIGATDFSRSHDDVKVPSGSSTPPGPPMTSRLLDRSPQEPVAESGVPGPDDAGCRPEPSSFQQIADIVAELWRKVAEDDLTQRGKVVKVDIAGGCEFDEGVQLGFRAEFSFSEAAVAASSVARADAWADVYDPTWSDTSSAARSRACASTSRIIRAMLMKS